jgi:hypothetical protein
VTHYVAATSLFMLISRCKRASTPNHYPQHPLLLMVLPPPDYFSQTLYLPLLFRSVTQSLLGSASRPHISPCPRLLHTLHRAPHLSSLSSSYLLLALAGASPTCIDPPDRTDLHLPPPTQRASILHLKQRCGKSLLIPSVYHAVLT